MSALLWMLGAILNAWAADRNFKREDWTYGAFCVAVAAICLWQWASAINT